MNKSREDTLVEQLWRKNHKLLKELQKEKKKTGYLVRQIRKLQKELHERKRNYDASKQANGKARDV